MKSFLISLWKRRWCRLLGIVLLLCTLPLLHPFVRQTIFGPKIDGIPWCVWEDEIRKSADPAPMRKGWFHEMLAMLGFHDQARHGLDQNFEALPVYVHLAEDSDVLVRRHALQKLSHWRDKSDETLPILRRHLEDADAQCRLWSAVGVWYGAKDPQAIPVVLPLKDHADAVIQMNACFVLCDMASGDPALFEPLSQLAGDASPVMRFAAMSSMRHFGKRGVPILRQGLLDPGKGVRPIALQAAGELGKDAEDLIPNLQAFEGDVSYGRQAAYALHKIDPKRFPKPADPDRVE